MTGQPGEPAFEVDAHTRLVQQLEIILDKAAVAYDGDEGVVEDFIQYMKDWASRRENYRVELAARRGPGLHRT